MRWRGLFGPALSFAAFALLAYVFARDLMRWHQGRQHFPILAQLLILLLAAAMLALASTLFVQLWARMLAGRR